MGYRRWPNDISLSRGCQDKGTAIHEMGHTIGKISGFKQEQDFKKLKRNAGNC